MAATRTARQLIEGLEMRRLLAVVNGTAGNDTITVAISGANIVVTVNGTPNNFTDSTNSTIVINAGDGNDTVSVNSNSDNATTVNGGIGDDSVVVGGGDFDTNLGANVTVNGDVGTGDVVVINDTTDGVGSDTHTLTSTSYTKTLGPVLNYATIERFVLNAGAVADTVNVNSVAAATPVSVSAGDGNDTVVVGNGDYDSFILGNVSVTGGVGTDSVIVEDINDGGADTYTLDTTFTKDSDAAVLTASSDLFTISGPSAATAETYNINRFVGQVLVGCGAGNDTVNVGNGDYDSNLSLVTVQGDAGTDVLNYNDQTDGAADANVYDLFALSIRKADVNNVLTYDANLESVVINGSPNADLYNINTTAASIPITINAGAGNDTLDAGGPNGFNNDVDNAIANALRFNGGADTDRVDLTDTGDSADNETYSLSNTSFSKSSTTFGSLAFDGTNEVFVLVANAGANPINVGFFPDGRSITINGGDGNDTINTDNANAVLSDTSTLAVSGGAGTDAWVVNESGDLDASTYRLTSSTFQVTAGNLSGVYSYDATVESFQFTGGTVGTEFDLDSSSGSTAVLIDLGDGNDTLVVGGGDLDTNLAQNLTVAGGAGTDSIVLDDSTDSAGADTATLTVGTVLKNIRTISYNTFEAQQYLGSTQDTVFTVDSGSIPTTITGGSGNEFVSVAPTSDDIDAFSSTLVVNGGGGSDTVSLNDTLDTLDDTYNISSTTVTKPGAGAFQGLTYTSVERLGISAGAANHTFNLNSTLAGTAYPINAGGGNDTFNVGGTDGIADGQLGTVTLNGEAGTDVLNYDDSASGVARTFIIRNTRIDRPDTGIIDFPTTESAVFTAGNQGDTFNVLATAAATPVTINAGSGDDTVNLGDGLLGGVADLNAAITVQTALGIDVVNVGAGDLDELVGPTTLFDSGGVQTVTVNDAADAGSVATSYTILNGTLSRGGAGTVFGGLTFTTGSQVLFDFNQSGTPITYTDTGTVGGATLQGNGGIDTITIVNATNSVTVRGGAGLDSIVINSDSADVANVVFDQNEDFQDITNRAGGLLTFVGDIAVRTQTSTIAQTTSGVINLNRGTLISATTSAVSDFVTALDRGYNGGAWNGSSNGSFRSGTAAASSRVDALGYAVIGTGAGQLNATTVGGPLAIPVAAGDLVVTYTLAGDTDLDRDVDFTDLLAVAQNYAPTVGGKNWRQGNFNYNTPDTAVGAVGFPDLLALSQNYAQTALTSGSDVLDATEGRRTLSAREDDVLA